MSKRNLPKFDRAELDNMRESMLDLERTIEIVDGAIDRMFAKEPNADSIRSVTKHSYRRSLTAVATRAQSPIERILFTSLLIGSAVADPMSVVVIETGTDALAQVKHMQRNCQIIRAIGAEAKRRKKSRRELILEGEAHGVPRDEVEWLLTQDIGNMISDDAFNIILQAPIPSERIRLDALVFVPSRPTFLVAVECDGYEWHGNKETFTADRQRDRTLKGLECDVVRFSGSEIHTNPMAASISLAEYLVAAHKRHKMPRKWVWPKDEDPR